MTETTHDADPAATPADEVPHFPATAPAVFSDPAAVRPMFTAVLGDLAGVVTPPDDALDRPTPCASYTVEQLRDHVLGWLQHFAVVAHDAGRTAVRADPGAYRAATDPRGPADVVRAAAADLDRAVADGAAGHRLLVSQATMDGDAVLGMALGEYLVHGWDLAVATGRPWSPPA